MIYPGLCSTNPAWNVVNNFNLHSNFLHTSRISFFICLIIVLPPSFFFSPSEVILFMCYVFCICSSSFFPPFHDLHLFIFFLCVLRHSSTWFPRPLIQISTNSAYLSFLFMLWNFRLEHVLFISSKLLSMLWWLFSNRQVDR